MYQDRIEETRSKPKSQLNAEKQQAVLSELVKDFNILLISSVDLKPHETYERALESAEVFKTRVERYNKRLINFCLENSWSITDFISYLQTQNNNGRFDHLLQFIINRNEVLQDCIEKEVFNRFLFKLSAVIIAYQLAANSGLINIPQLVTDPILNTTLVNLFCSSVGITFLVNLYQNAVLFRKANNTNLAEFFKSLEELRSRSINEEQG
jgi:hypothetical protein